MKLHGTLAVWLVLWAGAAGAMAQTAPAVDPSAFINGGGLESPKLSPDGKRLAGMLRTNALRALVTQNIDGSDRKGVITEDKPDAELDFVRWVSNERVLMRLTQSGGVRLERQTLPVSRLMSIGIDGSSPKLMMIDGANRGLINHTSSEGHLACPSSPFVTVQTALLDGKKWSLGRFDARSGKLAGEIALEAESVTWWIDGAGHARLFRLLRDGEYQWKWLPADRKEPRSVDWPALEAYQRWNLLGFDANPAQVIALTERNGAWQVVRIDVNAPEQAEVLADVSEPGRSVSLLRNEQTCQAIGLRSDDQTVLWGDNLAPFWAGLVQALPEPRLVLKQWQGDRVLVQMSQATLPTRYLLGLRSSRKMELVAETYSRLPDTLGLTERSFSAGDVQVRWLQREDAKGALPTVVCLDCEFDRSGSGLYKPLSAYLAYRGFGVLAVTSSKEPGPTLMEQQANGASLYEAAMRIAAEKGWSDPQRVSIVAGHSLASWIAMAIGAAHQPPIRAVAVSSLVSDMGHHVFQNILRSRDVSETTKASYRRQSGTTTEAKLTAASPIARVAQWHAPLLLVHAERDAAVHVRYSQNLADAMKAAGKPVTLLRLPSTTEDLAHPPYRARVIKAIDELLAPLLTSKP